MKVSGDGQTGSAALDAAEIEVGLVIDAPELVGDERAVRRVQLEHRVG